MEVRERVGDTTIYVSKTKHPQFFILLFFFLTFNCCPFPPIVSFMEQAYSSAIMGAATLDDSNGHAGNGVGAKNITAGA